jgi:hypothetical protein
MKELAQLQIERREAATGWTDRKKVRESREYAGSDTERLDYGVSVVWETRMAFQRVASINFWIPSLNSRLYSTPLVNT